MAHWQPGRSNAAASSKHNEAPCPQGADYLAQHDDEVEAPLEDRPFAKRVRDHASTLYLDERALKFCAQRAVPGQVCSQRLYDSLSVLSAIATVLVRDPLFGDKGRGVMAPGL